MQGRFKVGGARWDGHGVLGGQRFMARCGLPSTTPGPSPAVAVSGRHQNSTPAPSGEDFEKALILRYDPYTAVAADPKATGQAIIVVVLVGLATGFLGGGVTNIVAAIVGRIISWALWALFVFWVASPVFHFRTDIQADWDRLVRSTGFAQSPGVLLVLAIIPSVGTVLPTVVSL